MVERVLFAPGGSTEAKQDAVLIALGLLQTELNQKFEAGEEVALDAATLAALETVNATVTGEVALDAATLAALETVNAVCSGTVALDAGTLAALGTITVSVSNWPVEFPLPAAQVVSLTPQTDALTDAELRAIDVSVEVTNHPVDFPLPAAQVATLTPPTPQTDALTDVELRAADVDTADSGEREYTHVVATVTASGDTTVHTPAAGKAIRLRWLYAINQPTATSGPLIKVSLGGNEIYRVWALSKRQRVTGPVDGPLVVNLDTGGYVAVSALIEEI